VLPVVGSLSLDEAVLPTLRVHGPGTSCPSPLGEVSVETIHFTMSVDTPGRLTVSVDVFDINEYGPLLDERDIASDEGPLRIDLSIVLQRLEPDQARDLAAALTRAADWVDRARS
jgi:hypothetical protein